MMLLREIENEMGKGSLHTSCSYFSYTSMA